MTANTETKNFKAVQFLNDTRQFIIQIETTLVDVIALVIPYISPLAPAYLSYTHLVEVLHFPALVGLAVALTVELLGLSSISTTITFWRASKAITGGSNKMLLLALATSLGYLIAVLSLTLGLGDYKPNEHIAVFMLSVLSVIGALVISLRATYAKKVIDERQSRLERKVNKQITQQASNLQQHVTAATEVAQIPLRPQKRDWRLLTAEERAQIANMSTYDVQQTYGLPARTASAWKQRVRNNGLN